MDPVGECSSHALLSSYGLAPPLLARFNNGLLYRYVAGSVCSVKDLSSRGIYNAVANRLGQWHGVLPVNTTQPPAQESLTDPLAAPIPPTENTLWGVMDRWTGALPSETPAQAARKQELLEELRYLKEESGLKGMDGGVGFIFGHCDLLNGNVIILPAGNKECEDQLMEETGVGGAVGDGDTCTSKVHFIDYEYDTSPATSSHPYGWLT